MCICGQQNKLLVLLAVHEDKDSDPTLKFRLHFAKYLIDTNTGVAIVLETGRRKMRV